jgi:hypothetical protein
VSTQQNFQNLYKICTAKIAIFQQQHKFSTRQESRLDDQAEALRLDPNMTKVKTQPKSDSLGSLFQTRPKKLNPTQKSIWFFSLHYVYRFLCFVDIFIYGFCVVLPYGCW